MSSTYIFIESTGSIGSLYVELDRKAPKSKIVLPAANFQKSTNKPLGGFICTSPSWLSVTMVLVPNAVELEWHLKREAFSGPISFEVQQNDI